MGRLVEKGPNACFSKFQLADVCLSQVLHVGEIASENLCRPTRLYCRDTVGTIGTVHILEALVMDVIIREISPRGELGCGQVVVFQVCVCEINCSRGNSAYTAEDKSGVPATTLSCLTDCFLYTWSYRRLDLEVQHLQVKATMIVHRRRDIRLRQRAAV